MTTRFLLPLVALFVVVVTGDARGDEPTYEPPAHATPVATAAPAPLPPAPQPDARTPFASSYAGPFQLRVVMPRTSVRLDTTVAPYTFNDAHALQTVLFLSGQVRLTENISAQAKWGFDDNRTGGAQNSKSGVLNPSFGFLLGVPIGSMFRFAASVSMGLPLATGGGNNPDPNAVLLQRQGALARSAMDNTSFAINDLGFPTGVSVAFAHQGVSAQVDWTIIASGRIKGEEAQSDTAKVNSTFGLFAGYFVVPETVSLGVELRYQYYLTTPEAVLKNPAARENLTAAFGARLDVDLSGGARMRPGLSYGAGLAGPVREQSVRMVQFDVPILF